MPMPKMKLASKVLLFLSLLVTLFLFIIGESLQDPLMELGLTAYLQQSNWQGVLFIFGFVFAFPLGLLFIVLAGLLNSDARGKYYFVLIHVVILGAVLVTIWPFILGRENSPSYFGYSGGLLLILIFSVAWFWAEQRQNCQPSQRKVVDLKGTSYFFFALATWNLCGVVGMPGYALYPERSLAVNAYPFIIGQVKVVMLYFVLAWLSLLLSYLVKRSLG